MMHLTILALEVSLFVYFVAVNVIDLITIVVALVALPRSIRIDAGDALGRTLSAFSTPVSVLVAAFNEEAGIEATVRSLVAFKYVEHEVIVINDGSTDETMARLTKAFALVPFSVGRYVKFTTKPIRMTYRSLTLPNLFVIDKENGGKGDALNAGLNAARYPLFFSADGDTLYADDCLEQMVQPFLEDVTTVACGASVGILNGAEMRDGRPFYADLPRKFLVRCQILEYLRSFLNCRAGWAPLGGLLIVSGACGLWKKDVVIAAGGFAVNTLVEDLEMTVRVHSYMRAQRKRYRVAFVAPPVCWTTVPETIAQLRNQRIGWHRHLSEVVSIHRELLFNRRGGLVEWLAFPNLVLGEWLAPVWLLGGLLFLIWCWMHGILSLQSQLALLSIVFSLTLMRAAAALLLDEISVRSHRLRVVWGLFWTAVFEQFGFRQLVALWSLAGIAAFVARAPIRGRSVNIPSVFDKPYRPAYAQNEPISKLVSIPNPPAQAGEPITALPPESLREQPRAHKTEPTRRPALLSFHLIVVGSVLIAMGIYLTIKRAKR
jgi:cellulose synthase/poly-beta-1,6-N-acetylglucosamine synthase-like glycosyltransferase